MEIISIPQRSLVRPKSPKKPSGVLTAFDPPKILKQLTGKKGWREMEGPESGCGIDYWYSSGKSEAYINIDQTFCTISVNGESIFAGDKDELLTCIKFGATAHWP